MKIINYYFTNTKVSLRTRVFILLVFLLICNFSYSEVFYNTKIGYYLDVPEGWTVADDEDLAFIAFEDPTHTAVFQVFAFPGYNFSQTYDMYENIKIGLAAEGEPESFTYSGREAVFADLSFVNGRIWVSGHAVFINTDEFDYIILAYSQLDVYEANKDFLLSCIDSFAINEDEKFAPGPVSQFYNHDTNTESVKLEMNGINVYTEFNINAIDAAARLIEREARIIVNYTDYNEFVTAWHRYYRIIYRDNYLRLGNIVELLEDNFRLRQKSTNDKVILLLDWIQNFEYYRTGTTSDLTSPVETAYFMSGDCDSRALLFIILLNYLNIDSILLVSTEYSHSGVGVGIEGNGAKIWFNNKQYLFAELTSVVDIGLVDSTMADPAGWISIPLGE